MNLKNLLLSVAALAATPLFAATYYVTPEGAGEKNGSSWENAFDTEGFREQALKNADGDVYELAAGTYKPTACIIFKRATYATINGATDGRTILSGDQDDNNYATSNDLQRLIRFMTVTGVGNTSKPVVINNIDFTSVYTQNNTDPTSDDSKNNTGVAGIGALYVDNSGDVTVNNCNFYGNWANGSLGGPAVHLRRSSVKFVNCVFRNNSATYTGGAVRLTSDNEQKGITTFENCVFKNNTNYHNYGGAICFSSGNSVNIINTVISGNKAVASGAALYADSGYTDKNNKVYPCMVRIVNSTIAGNEITGDTPDGQISSTQSANIKTINSIIVSNKENTADFYFNGDSASDKFSFTSGGYNYVGSVIDVAESATRAEETAAKINWLDTDNVNAENTYASIFGENKINSDNVIVPVKYFAGASGEQVEEAVKEWGLPADVDVTKDQNGTERTEGMMPGAYAITQKDIDGTTVSVINVIDDAANAPRLVKVANGVYTIEGATEGVTAYTVNGATVAATSGNTIDLSSFANGLYIIKSGNAIFKVMK